MKKLNHRAKNAASPRGDETDLSEDPGVDELGSSGGSRKPYKRPSVEKRRSLGQATLVSAGGVPGTLTSGGP